MKLTKVSHKNDHTYIVIRSNDGKEYCTITIPGAVEVEMNKEGTALSIKPRFMDKEGRP